MTTRRDLDDWPEWRWRHVRGPLIAAAIGLVLGVVIGLVIVFFTRGSL